MPTTSSRTLPWPILLLAAAPLLLPGRPLAQAAPDAPHVSVRVLVGAPIAGRLIGLDAEALRLEGAADGSPRTIELERVVEMRFPASSTDASPGDQLRVHLVAGDALVGTFAGPSDDGLRLTMPAVGTIGLSFEVIRTIEALPAGAGPYHHPADTRPPAKSEDVVYDVREDEIRGTVLEATAEELALETQRGRRLTVPWRDLRVAHLRNDALAQPDGLQAEVELWNGSRIAVAGALRYADEAFTLSSRSLPSVAWKVPCSAVRAARWWGGRFVYASALAFRSTYTPYYPDPAEVGLDEIRGRWFGTTVDRRRDPERPQRVYPLRLGGETYRRGFGVNSRSTIEIDLHAAYKTFRAGFGIDDVVLTGGETYARFGNVEARILGDGKVLWEAKDVEGGQPRRTVGPLDVSSVKTLVLEVGFGKMEFANDLADWVDPILERK